MPLRPWLWLPANVAHSLLPYALGPISKALGNGPTKWKSLEWEGLHFPNPLGIAGGVDKNAEHIEAWTRLGAGFIEIGTITPEPQNPNPGTILSRSNSNQSLWNKMGFPNHGVQSAKAQLESLSISKRQTPLFANIGKNRDTKNEDAPAAYAHLIAELQTLVDAFVINISSPNTEGLRQLLEPKNLKSFLSQIVLHSKSRKPLLLKLSPDMTESEIISAMDIASELEISGFTLTNTLQNSHMHYPNLFGGGVSGLPLQKKSMQILDLAKKHLDRLNSKKLLVSVGGILTAEDVKMRLELGADLVQVYTALVFEGPLFFKKISTEASRWR
jgi:dihydroorotate dehydrogenase